MLHFLQIISYMLAFFFFYSSMRKENIPVSYPSCSIHTIETPSRHIIKLNYVQMPDIVSLDILSLRWLMYFPLHISSEAQ